MARIPLISLSPDLQELIQKIDTDISKVQAASLEAWDLIESAKEKLATEAAHETLTTYLKPETQDYCSSESGLKAHRKYSKISPQLRIIHKNWNLTFQDIVRQFGGVASNSASFIRELSTLSLITASFDHAYTLLKGFADKRINRIHTRRGVSRKPWVPADVIDVIKSRENGFLSIINNDWNIDKQDLIRHFNAAAINSPSFLYTLSELARLLSFTDACTKLKATSQQRLLTAEAGASRAQWCVTDIAKVVDAIENGFDRGSPRNKGGVHNEKRLGEGSETIEEHCQEEHKARLDEDEELIAMAAPVPDIYGETPQMTQIMSFSPDSSTLQQNHEASIDNLELHTGLYTASQPTRPNFQPTSLQKFSSIQQPANVSIVPSPPTTIVTEPIFNCTDDDHVFDGGDDASYEGFSDSGDDADASNGDETLSSLAVEDVDASFQFLRKRKAVGCFSNGKAISTPKRRRISDSDIHIENGRNATPLHDGFSDAVDDSFSDVTPQFFGFPTASTVEDSALIIQKCEAMDVPGDSTSNMNPFVTKKEGVKKDMNDRAAKLLDVSRTDLVASVLACTGSTINAEIQSIQISEDTITPFCSSSTTATKVPNTDTLNKLTRADVQVERLMQTTESMLLERYSNARDTLRPNQWISSTVFEVVLDISNRQDVFIGDPQWISTSGTLPQRVSRPKEGFRKFLIPIHHKSPQHWTIAFIDLDLKAVDHYDSLQSPAIQPIVKAALTHAFDELSLQMCFRTIGFPQQKNSWDCGVFAIIFGLCRLSGVEVPQDVDGSLWRDLFKEILTIKMSSILPDTALVNKQTFAVAEKPRELEPSTANTDVPISQFAEVMETGISKLENRLSHLDLVKEIVLSSQKILAREHHSVVEMQQSILREADESRRILDTMSSVFRIECLAVIDQKVAKARQILRERPRTAERALLLMQLQQIAEQWSETGKAELGKVKAVLAQERLADISLSTHIITTKERRQRLMLMYQNDID